MFKCCFSAPDVQVTENHFSFSNVPPRKFTTVVVDTPTAAQRRRNSADRIVAHLMTDGDTAGNLLVPFTPSNAASNTKVDEIQSFNRSRTLLAVQSLSEVSDV